jgi:hypothetical protein
MRSVLGLFASILSSRESVLEVDFEFDFPHSIRSAGITEKLVTRYATLQECW